MVAPLNHNSSLRLNDVPGNLRSGMLAVKWPEDNTRPPLPNVVNLSIDPKGFYLMCHNKHIKTIECFDLALIHDTRTGSAVSLPPGAKECSAVNIGSLGDTLSSKWLTIYYGDTFVPSPSFRTVHFAFSSSDFAQEWAKRLFEYGHNQCLKNLSSSECLEKFHSRIIHGLIDLDKQVIPVRRLIDFLCEEPHDQVKKTKIAEALKTLNLPHTVNSTILPEQLPFDVFFSFYTYLMDRQEIDSLFNTLDVNQKRHLSWESMRDFMKKQDDASADLSEAGHYEQKAEDLLAKQSQRTGNPSPEGIDRESFLRYLLSVDNLIVDPVKFDLFMNMDKPLTHYFIASSHNTYLTGGQWTGRASDEMYRQVLLAGCRCIEIDVVDSENNEPVIKHIYTPVVPISFIKVITAIRDYAFKTSPFPLIISIENHCGPAAQVIMAKNLVDVFGGLLLTEPLVTHPCEENYPLPSPNDLRYTILIKNKKLQPRPPAKVNHPKTHTTITHSSSDPSTDISVASSSSAALSQGSLAQLHMANNHPRHGILYNDSSSDEEAFHNRIDVLEIASTTIDVPPESKATKAMSDLVIYVVPVRFLNFARAQELKRSYEMSSFSEDQAFAHTRDSTRDFLAYNQRQCSRIYPRGTRVASKNYDPYPFWRVGCQMVALNYQTLDAYMQLNLGMFSYNNACGYIEKPAALCEPHSLFDPQALNSTENVESCDIHLRVLSGQFLCQTREPSLVNIQLHGTYDNQTRRREHHLRAKRWNGFQAVYDDAAASSSDGPVHFTKIVLSEMAALRFEVLSDNGTLIGQCFIPVSHLRSGYRHVVLRNKINVPVRLASLFIFVRKTTYASGKDQASANSLHKGLTNTNHNSSVSCEDLSARVVRRNHDGALHDSTVNLEKCAPPIPVMKANWYEEHVLAGSKFRDQKGLCRVSRLHDMKPEDAQQQNAIIDKALRSISVDYKKKIQKEEMNLQIHLAARQDNPPRSKAVRSATSKNESETPEQRLLSLYTEKFRRQERAENQHLNIYFDKTSKKIRDQCKRQLDQLTTIFKEEKSRVENDAQYETIEEVKPVKRPETSLKKLFTLNEKSAKTNSDCGASTIQKLEAMYMEAKDTLQINFAAALNELEEERSSKRDACTEKYRKWLDELTTQWQCRIYQSEYDVLRADFPMARRAGVADSLPSAGNHFSRDLTRWEPRCRRQTMD